MSDLKEAFEAAAQDVQELNQRPDQETLLRLYALYKQSTAGNVSGKRPGFTNPVGRAKYDAWSRVEGLSQGRAMQSYVDLVEQVRAEESD